MKRTKSLQTVPDEHQKKRKASPASNQSGQSPMSELLDQVTTGSSDTGQSSPAGPTIVVDEAEAIEDSLGSTKKQPGPARTSMTSGKVQQSDPLRQDSSKPLDASRNPQSPAKGSFLQDTILCDLRVTVEDSTLVKHFNKGGRPKCVARLNLPLNKPESYEEIEGQTKNRAKTLSSESDALKELKFFYGNCTIVGDNGTKARRPLRSPEDWTEVNEAIVGYWTHTHERFHLFITRHYLASQEQPTEDEPFKDVKSSEISDLMKETWEKKFYIPHNALDTVISDTTIYWIIKRDRSVPQEQKDTFILRVQAEGRILFAMCVHVSLKMKCLKKLLDDGLKDSALPLEENFQCHWPCRHLCQRLVREQGRYQTERFNEGDHKNLPSHAVVPLHFFPRAQGQDDPDCEVTEGYGNVTEDIPSEENATREAARCGFGAYSNVFCVKLNPNHHSLSVDLDSCFALKEFIDKPKLAKNFDRELAMLKELRKYSHPHIVTHLATWTQDEKYYMLFPFAQCNLREYMTLNKFAKSDAFWLLGQFHGMAEAVKQIHDLSHVDAPTSSLTVTTSAAAERRTGWHHDLKPENILFFKDSPSSHGVFRISDWGSGKVNTYRSRSYHTESPIGTLTYEPPEFTYEGKTSRPYDLWSLGCVFLELLTWAVFGPTSVETFSDQRDDKRNPDSGTSSTRDDTFWQKDGNEFVLRRIVVTQLQRLDKALMPLDAPPFKEVVGYVRRMLETQTDKRIKALELCDLLKRTNFTKTIEVERTSDESEPITRLSLIPMDHQSPDVMDHAVSPSSRTSGPAYAEHYDLSPSDMSPRASRHSRNSSASELMPSIANRSRQSSNASNRSNLSIPDRKGSHSSANPPSATEGGS